MLSPLLVWSLHTSRHMQRDERRPSANQSILLTLLFIYFLSPSATAQLPLCVCERGMGKGVEILVEPLKSSLLATVAIPFPSYYPAIHCSCSPLWQLKKKASNKNNTGLFSAYARCQGDSQEAKPWLNTGVKAALLLGALRAPKRKAPVSAAWAELHGWNQGQMYITCRPGREEDSNTCWLLYFMVVTSSSHTERRDKSLYF